MQVGMVEQVWRFPVKSLQGERITTGELTDRGLVGDRAYALRSTETGKVLTAKRYGMLFEGSARTDDDGTVLVTLPGQDERAADDPGLAAVFTDWLGLPCRLVPPDPAEAPEFDMSMNADEPERDMFAWPCPEGTFLDLAAAHVLTTASLAAARALHPEGDWDVRRFRPTVLVASPDDAEGFVEDTWVGGRVQVGGATIEVLMATPRCPMPPRAQPGLARDQRISATLRDHNDNNLGIYASVVQRGPVAVGDPVSVL